jgi:hypothetical protein
MCEMEHPLKEERAYIPPENNINHSSTQEARVEVKESDSLGAALFIRHASIKCASLPPRRPRRPPHSPFVHLLHLLVAQIIQIFNSVVRRPLFDAVLFTQGCVLLLQKVLESEPDRAQEVERDRPALEDFVLECVPFGRVDGVRMGVGSPGWWSWWVVNET